MKIKRLWKYKDDFLVFLQNFCLKIWRATFKAGGLLIEVVWNTGLTVIKNESFCTAFTDSLFPRLPSLNYHLWIYNNYILNSKGDIITSLFRKPTKVSTNNFKIDINGISDLLKMCKNIISAKNLTYQQIRNFIPCHRKCITNSYLN